MSENDYTFCADCAHVHPDSRGRGTFYWLCTQHKRLESFGFVSRGLWDKDEPFLRCVNVNGGACLLFEQRKETPAKAD